VEQLLSCLRTHSLGLSLIEKKLDKGDCESVALVQMPQVEEQEHGQVEKRTECDAFFNRHRLNDEVANAL